MLPKNSPRRTVRHRLDHFQLDHAQGKQCEARINESLSFRLQQQPQFVCGSGFFLSLLKHKHHDSTRRCARRVAQSNISFRAQPTTTHRATRGVPATFWEWYGPTLKIHRRPCWLRWSIVLWLFGLFSDFRQNGTLCRPQRVADRRNGMASH